MPSLRVSHRILWYWHILWLVPAWLFPGHPPALLLHHSQFFQHAALNPITQLTLNLEHLAASSPATDPRELIKQSLASVKHLQSLLLTAQTDSVTSPFSVKSALQEVIIRNHQPHFGKFVMNISNVKSSVHLNGNVYYFQEALDCVIHNAFEAYAHSENYKIVHVVGTLQTNFLVFTITDYGRGMDWLTRKFALKIGFSHKPQLQDHGRGLAFVKQVIEDHFKGQLALNSQPGIGTVVMIKVPLG